MSNATDDLIEAEKMIRSTITNFDEQERSLQICRWLLGFNSIEKGFKLKCRRRNVPDICFCIDRHGYGDCEPEKVKTWFFCVRNNKLIFRPIALNAPYLEQEKDRPQLLTYIRSSESKKLDLDTLKIHIFESYKLLLNNLQLLTNVSGTNNGSLQNRDPQDNSYQPTREDVEKILREIAPKGKEIDEEVLKRRIEFAFAREKRKLKPGWWEITKRNLVEWSKKG